MNRLEALEAAAKIVNKARVDVWTVNEGAYQFLLRVTAYINAQSNEAFASEFQAPKLSWTEVPGEVA